MDAASLPPAGLVGVLAPAQSPPATESAFDSDPEFNDVLASAAGPGTDGLPLPERGKSDTQKGQAGATIAAWIPPTLVTGLPLPSLSVETTEQAGGGRIFGSPSGVIPASLGDMSALAPVAAVPATLGLTGLDAIAAAATTPQLGDAAVAELGRLLPSPDAGSGPAPSPAAAGSPSAAATGPAGPGPAPLQTELAIDFLRSDANPASDPASNQATGGGNQSRPNPAAIAAGLVVAGQTATASLVNPQATAAALAADAVAVQPDGSAGVGTANNPGTTAAPIVGPIGGQGEAPAPASVGQQAETGFGPRFDFSVTDNGIGRSSQARAGPEDAGSFANMLGTAAAASPNLWSTSLAGPEILGQPLTELQSRALVDQVVQRASLLRSPDRTEMTLELTPPHLGTVHLHLTQSSGGGLSVHMRADDPHVQQVLAGSIEQLTARLHEQGHTVSVDLHWDREAGREAPDRGYQGEGPQREQAEPDAAPDPSTNIAPTLRSGGSGAEPLTRTNRRVDYRA